MKEWFNDIKKVFFFGSLFITMSLLFLECQSNAETKSIIHSLEYSQKGYLKILSLSTPSGKSSTYSGNGYIVNSKDTLTHYHIILGIHKIYKEFEDVVEGDTVAIWHTSNNYLVMERRFETQKETIDWVNNEEDIRTKISIKIVLAVWCFYFFIFVIVKWVISQILSYLN